MYESPITLMKAKTNNFINEVNEKTDEVIFKAVVNVLPQVNKEELIKTLAYDREQYSKGYKDRDSEIVWCKDCRYQVHCYQTVGHAKTHDGFKEHWSEPIEFCSKGERKEP